MRLGGDWQKSSRCSYTPKKSVFGSLDLVGVVEAAVVAGVAPQVTQVDRRVVAGDQPLHLGPREQTDPGKKDLKGLSVAKILELIVFNFCSKKWNATNLSIIRSTV